MFFTVATSKSFPNPVVRQTDLRAYQGWTVREFADGTFDAVSPQGGGMTPVFDTFGEVINFLRENRQ